MALATCFTELLQGKDGAPLMGRERAQPASLGQLYISWVRGNVAQLFHPLGIWCP